MGSVAHQVTDEDRRARWAVGALFFTNGALFANLIPRLPLIKDDLGIGNAAYGLAVAAFPAGAIVAGLAAGTLVRRFGSAPLAVAGTVGTSLLTLAAGTTDALTVFVAAMLVAGAMDAVTDVGQNAHGLDVQRRYRRSIINAFHATWSVGAVSGGLMGAGAIALDVAAGVHLGLSALVFSSVALVALRFRLAPGSTDGEPGSGHDEPPPAAATIARRSVVVVLASLVGIAIAGTVVEDAGMSWAGVYLSGPLGASAAVAGLGYVALVGAQFVGRALGDRLVDRFGARAVARCGGAVTATGMGAALALPTIPTTLVGFAAAGLGVATLVPAAMQQADTIPGLRAATGLALVSWLMRLGFLCAPPLVGSIADHAGLRAGLLVVPAAGLAVIVLSRVLGAVPARG